MKLGRYLLSLLMVSVAVSFCNAQDEYNIFFLMRDMENMSAGDEVQLAYFENRADIGFIDIWDNARVRDPEAWLDLDPLTWADAADLVWVDESVSSSRLRDIQETTTPIINGENYACDTLGMIGPDADDDHGSPGTLNESGIAIEAGTHFGTDLLIINDTHPIIANAGLSNGIHTIYDDQGMGANGGGRMSWCTPNLEANILALIPGFEDDYPMASPLFVHEEGDEMADGRLAPGMRIQFFLSDTNRGPAPADDPRGGTDGSGPGWEATLLTDAGFALIDSTVNYALGIEPVTTIPGDVTGDGKVDASDLNIIGSNWQTNVDPPGSNGDLTGDGFVDAADLNLVGSNWQAGVPAAAAVPEPTGMTLVLFGVLGVMAIRRQR